MAKPSAEALHPKLYFNKTIPFEHEIIGFNELHPELQKEVKKILWHAKASRVGVIALANAISPYPTGIPGHMISIAAGCTVAALSPSENNPRGVLNAVQNYVLPYSVPHSRTKRLGNAIKKLREEKQSPFWRSDVKELLEKYHYGVIDNAGNLILLKHPLDKTSKNLKGWQLLKRLFLWKQPLQRTRFELNKPQLREKEKKPAFSPFKLPVPARVALAPVRL